MSLVGRLKMSETLLFDKADDRWRTEAENSCSCSPFLGKVRQRKMVYELIVSLQDLALPMAWLIRKAIWRW